MFYEELRVRFVQGGGRGGYNKKPKQKGCVLGVEQGEQEEHG